MKDKYKEWRIDLDEDFFRIYDKNKEIAAYFDPYYGDLHPKGMESEIIENMLKNHDVVSSGYLTVPFVKFGIFDVTDFASTVYDVEALVSSTMKKISQWKKLIESTNTLQSHVVSVSHTNQDMLSITFLIKFQESTPLENKKLLEQLYPTLNLLQEYGLL